MARGGEGPAGRRLKVTDEQVETIQTLIRAGKPITAIASATGLSRPTVYRALRHNSA
jgi:DNA invertase Pin-like site-specific DNA recombinase